VGLESFALGIVKVGGFGGVGGLGGIDRKAKGPRQVVQVAYKRGNDTWDS
jgi:hypothetical protein